MRMVWVSHTGRIGGAELGLAEGVDALSDRGHEVHVVMPVEGPLRARLTSAASVHVTWLNWWALDPLPPLSHRLRRIAYDLTKGRERLVRIVQETDAEIVVSNTLGVWSGALAARRSDRPHVWFLHEFGREDHGMRFVLGERASLAFMRSHTDLFLVNSSALRSHFSGLLPSAKLRQVRYAVEVPAVPPIERPLDGTLRLVMLGERKPSKGQQEAVAAVKQLSAAGLDVELELIGREGEIGFDDRLRRLAGGAADRVRLVDHRANPYELIAQADAALMCSRAEGFGRVTVEAMKLGKPVVGAAAGATPEIVIHGWNGFLYEPGNSADLARWLERLYRDRKDAQEMGRRGKVWADAMFNRGVYGASLEAALDQL